MAVQPPIRYKVTACIASSIMASTAVCTESGVRETRPGMVTVPAVLSNITSLLPWRFRLLPCDCRDGEGRRRRNSLPKGILAAAGTGSGVAEVSRHRGSNHPSQFRDACTDRRSGFRCSERAGDGRALLAVNFRSERPAPRELPNTNTPHARPAAHSRGPYAAEQGRKPGRPPQECELATVGQALSPFGKRNFLAGGSACPTIGSATVFGDGGPWYRSGAGQAGDAFSRAARSRPVLCVGAQKCRFGGSCRPVWSARLLK